MAFTVPIKMLSTYRSYWFWLVIDELQLQEETINTLRKENRVLEKELKLLGNRVSELEDLLNKQTKQMEGLLETIDDIKEKSEEDDQRIEVQHNDMIEQQIALQELFLSLQMSDKSCGHPGFKVANNEVDNSKHLWILRRHQRNLVSVTKPFIPRVIKTSEEAGIVSRNVGRCATKCSIPNHDCASGFYKALLVSVGESPRVLEIFLKMMVKEFDSEPCSRLCSQILDEVYQ